jgi:hypothetical protein
MTPAGWLNHRSGVAWRARKASPEGRLVARMNKFTLLDDAMRGFGAAAAEGWVGDAGRRQHLVGIHDPSGERATCLAQAQAPPKPQHAANNAAKRPFRGLEQKGGCQSCR